MKKLIYLIALGVLSCTSSPIEPIPNIDTNGGEPYDHKKTYVIDHDSVNNNYLVRGNEPLLETGYSAYNEINSELKIKIDSSFDLRNYTLIDISLISSQGLELNILYDEFLSYGYPLGDTLASLNLNPPLGWPPFMGWNLDSSKAPWNPYYLYGNKVQVGGNQYNGQFIWWPVQACGDTLSDCKDVVGRQYGFTELIDYINTLMTTKKNIVIYFHCIHGHDRTSVVNSGYIMKYKGVSFDSATTHPAPIGGMKPSKDGYDPLKPNYWDMLYVWNKDFLSSK